MGGILFDFAADSCYILIMSREFSRTQLLFGEEAMRSIYSSRVAVFGLGGVGGYVVEALARAGVGALDLIDCDVIDETNINRQILATHSVIGRKKTEVAAERVAQINAECRVKTHNIFYTEQCADALDFSVYDYVVDAIDTVSGKLAVITRAKSRNVPVISCMGTGNKLDPTAFTVADIYSTDVCPLARVMRRELKKRGVDSLKAVYSREQPAKLSAESDGARKAAPASNSFVPPVAGFILAGEVIKHLALKKGY